MPSTFRNARAGDVAAIVALYARPHVTGMLHVPDAAVIEAWTSADHTHAFVVERDGAIAAFALVLQHESWLFELAHVVAAQPGTGAGWFAVRESATFAFASHAHRIYLEVIAINARARRVYETVGFALEGTWRHGYRREDGAYLDLCAYGMLATDGRARARVGV